MSNERLLTKEQTAHKIDIQLYWESLTTLALVEGNLTIDEYEAHKDAHLDEILALFSYEAEIVRADTLKEVGEWLGEYLYDYAEGEHQNHLVFQNWDDVEALKEGKFPNALATTKRCSRT